MYCYCTVVARAPMRAQASHRSEMVNELLLGETVELLEKQHDFLRVKAQFDGYEGWVQHSQLWLLRGEIPEALGYVTRHTAQIRVNYTWVPVPFGTPFFAADAMSFSGSVFELRYDEVGADATPTLREIWKVFEGAPYLWGGKTPWGTDCSGFVQQVFKVLGQKLPRDAWQQAQLGTTVDFLEAALPGDLAFFDNSEGKIIHVGILIDDHAIVHSSGNVRVDKIDHHGIINNTTGKRTHQLRTIKRLG
ncbi:MAG: hydrolase Nlp/P60 [Bacteroidetes bacterium]|nr:MAG: hydrolase Nlp/P60 [Bacteroidota bacterium]